MSINLYFNPDEPVAAKRKSRFIEEPKVFATEAPRHKGYIYYSSSPSVKNWKTRIDFY